ncbi:BnaC03g16700D [Brassica napus]|uniref:BnaC03g16700D protein n=1 Tax=Brassica napus TaxID=3708 RepID=A0A078GF89_BRANA|nr:BnaC03g16700D [Brassica napus]
MEEELRDMKARKAHYDMLHFMKRIHMTTSQGKDTSSAKTSRMTGCILGSHGLWLLRECDELKAQVRMLLRRVSDLERVL